MVILSDDGVPFNFSMNPLDIEIVLAENPDAEEEEIGNEEEENESSEREQGPNNEGYGE